MLSQIAQLVSGAEINALAAAERLDRVACAREDEATLRPLLFTV